MLKYPEKELVQVQAEKIHYAPARPLNPEDVNAPLKADRPYNDLLDIQDVLGKRVLTSKSVVKFPVCNTSVLTQDLEAGPTSSYCADQNRTRCGTNLITGRASMRIELYCGYLARKAVIATECSWVVSGSRISARQRTCR